jgi:tetratricopeptide (TPR) repeat protein
LRRWAWPAAFAAAALAFDPYAPASAVKAPIALAVVVACAALGWRAWRLTAGGTFLLLLCGWLALSLAWAKHPAPIELAPWLIAALGTLPLAGMSERRALARRFAQLILTGAGAIALVQWARGNIPHGGQGNPNWLGLTTAVCLPFAIADTKKRILECIPIALGIFALAVGASRAAWVGLAVSGLVFLRGRWRLSVAPLAVLLAIAAWRGGLLSAASGRLWIAGASWRAGVDALPLGTGLGGFSFAYLDAQAALLAPLDPTEAAHRFLNATTAHNDALQLFVEGGPVAVLLGLAAFASCLGVGRTASAAALAIGVASLGDSPLELPAVAIAVAFIAADSRMLTEGRLDRAIGGCALAVAALILPGTIRRYAAEHVWHQADALPIDQRIAALKRAARLDPTDGEARLALGLARLETDDDPHRALHDFADASAWLADVGAIIAAGNARLALGDPRAAAAAYREALRLDPGSFRARLNLVEALRRAGDLDEAESQLRIARRLQPNHPKLTQIAEQLRRARVESESGAH